MTSGGSLNLKSRRREFFGRALFDGWRGFFDGWRTRLLTITGFGDSRPRMGSIIERAVFTFLLEHLHKTVLTIEVTAYHRNRLQVGDCARAHLALEAISVVSAFIILE